jgi:tetratricopeptide (TPR) repeat protein
MTDVAKELRKLRWATARRTLAPAKPVKDETLVRAQALHSGGNYEEALDLLLGSTERDENPRYLRLIGLCLLGLRKADESIRAFARARDMNLVAADMEEVASDEANLTAALLAARREHDAVSAARRAIQADPTWIGAYINLIAALNRAHAYSELDSFLANIVSNHTDFVSDDDFKDRLRNDSDFIGIEDRLHHVILSQTGAPRT